MLLKDRPVYLLAGEEQFLKDEALAKIKSTFLDAGSADFNFSVFYAGATSIDKILECATTAPFLGQKRIVLVRQIEQFSTADQEFILSYLKNPQHKTLLILETAQTNLEENFFAQIRKSAQVIFCQPLEVNQLFAWLATQVAARNKKIEEKAGALLVENLGKNLQLLSSALDALSLYIGEKAIIEAPDVERLVGPDLNTNAFALFEAIRLHNKDRALQILDTLFKEGTNSAQILGAFAHQVISEKSRMQPSLFKQVLLELQKADSDIKTGKQNQRLALEILVTKLFNGIGKYIADTTENR